MNDTQILNQVLASLRMFAVDNMPASPSLLGEEADWIERKRADRRQAKEGMDGSPLNAELYAKLFPVKKFVYQNFWSCEHHPSAINNFFDSDLRGGCDECNPAT
jgi:hypothetical protein